MPSPKVERSLALWGAIFLYVFIVTVWQFQVMKSKRRTTVFVVSEQDDFGSVLCDRWKAAFVGFGGVAVREKVLQVADWFVTDFDDLTRVVRAYGGAK